MKYYCTKCEENRSSNHCNICDVELFEFVKTKMKVGNKFFTPNGIGRNGLTEFECIAELLANCFDWNINKHDSNKKAEIHIITDRSSFIQIIDNGVGMNINQLDKATNLADDTDIRKRLNEQEQRKGMYNMGMKVATLSLGWKFTITTISIEDQSKELVFEFDSKNLLDSNSEYMENLKIVPRAKPKDSPLYNFNSGTSILIENIVSSKDIPMETSIADQMRQRFQPDMRFLQQKNKLLFLVYDGDKNIRKNENDPGVTPGTMLPVLYYHDILKIDFENPKKWDQKREYIYTGKDENNNSVQYQLKGFINILKKRSISGDSGLNLYCRGQLIERFVKTNELDKGVLGSFGARNWERIYGELHLDGCLANNVKTKLNRNEAFSEVCKLIKDDLIQTYKKLTGATGDANLKLDQEVTRRLGTIEPIDPIDPDDPTEPIEPNIPTDPDEPSEPDDQDPLLEKDRMIKVNNNLYFQIRENWLVTSSRSKRTWKAMRNEIYQNEYPNKQIFELQIQIHTDSVQYKKIKEMYRNESDQNKVTTFFHKLIICEAITEIIFELNLFDKNKSREIVDQFVSPQIFNMKI